MVYDVAAGRLYLIGTIPDPLQDAVVTGERCCCGLCLLPMCAHKMLSLALLPLLLLLLASYV